MQSCIAHTAVGAVREPPAPMITDATAAPVRAASSVDEQRVAQDGTAALPTLCVEAGVARRSGDRHAAGVFL